MMMSDVWVIKTRKESYQAGYNAYCDDCSPKHFTKLNFENPDLVELWLTGYYDAQASGESHQRVRIA
jgi:hypothetical protein